MGNLDYRPNYRRNLPHIQPPATTLFVTFSLARSLPRPVLDQWARQKAQLQKELTQLRSPDERKRRERDFRRERFAGLEKLLDKAQTGPTWLAEKKMAQLVVDSMRYRDAKVYRLDAYCIMSNHVHTVFTPLPVTQADNLCHGAASGTQAAGLPVAQAGSLCYHSLASIMHSLKGHTAREGTQAAGLPVAQAGSLCYHSLASIMHSLKGHTAREGNQLLGRRGAFWEHESYDHYVRDEQELERIVTYVLSNPVKAGLWDPLESTCRHASLSIL